MDNNMPIIAKRVWNIVRVVFFMLKKSMCKSKILLDLHVLMKRGKLAGKALANHLIPHLNNHHGSNANLQFSGPGEYEFSCSNRPYHHFPFQLNKRKNRKNRGSNNYYLSEEDMNRVLEIMMTSNNNSGSSNSSSNNNPYCYMGTLESPSPMLPGHAIGWSPAVRQLRITDSPFPLQNGEVDSHVDEAAEEFIKRFYSQLIKQQQ